jgi:hypothetical protein
MLKDGHDRLVAGVHNRSDFEAKLSGRAVTPMAEGAGLLSSPKTRTSGSVAPFATRCCSVNSGVELTKTMTFTIRATRDRSPSSALSVASRCSVTNLAAIRPSSVDRSAPSFPVWVGLPSTSEPLTGRNSSEPAVPPWRGWQPADAVSAR